MKKQPEKAVFVFSILVLLGSFLPPVFAVNWQEGGTNQALNSGTDEIVADVKIVHPPTPDEDNTIVWLGGQDDNNYLNQPELRAWTSTYWKVFFEAFDQTAWETENIHQTSLNAFTNDSVEMNTWLTGTGDVCFYAVKGTTQVSKCFDDVVYGDEFDKAWTHLESYDFDENHFEDANGTIEFTNVQGYDSGGVYTISLDENDLQMDCVSVSAGSGWTDIVIDCP